MPHTLNAMQRRWLQPAWLITPWLALTPCAVLAQSNTVQCTGTVSGGALNIGDIVPWRAAGKLASGTVSVQCRNNGGDTKLSVCLNIGTGTAGGSVITDRKIKSPSGDTLPINITTTNGEIFGSYYSGKTAVQLPEASIKRNATYTFNPVPITVAIGSGAPATATTGRYTSSYAGIHTAMTIEANNFWPNCLNVEPRPGQLFEFSVSANVPDFCEVTSKINNMVFPETAGIQDVRKTATTSVQVRCTNGTPYRINLSPSNGSTTGVGKLSAISPAGNTDQVEYRLFQDESASTTPWGNQPMNGKQGTGSGEPQTMNIYGAIAPNLNATPGDYKDTVVLTVSY